MAITDGQCSHHSHGHELRLLPAFLRRKGGERETCIRSIAIWGLHGGLCNAHLCSLENETIAFRTNPLPGGQL
nr:hypothetical protein CFP56_09653 [Quercus suber]